MTDLPSPTKKATRAVSPPQPAAPLDPRGSFQREASTEWNSQIVDKAMRARQAVSRGQLGMPAPTTNNRRVLGATQSMPILSFSSHVPTTNDTLQAVYSTTRPNELPPMSEHAFYDNQERSRRSASQRSGQEGSGIFGGSFVSNSGYATSETAATEEAMGDGDGFDMDEVFGESKIQFPPSSFGNIEDSQSSSGTTRTITQNLKRAYDDGQQEGGAEDDEEMATTDVEDEGEDMAAALNAPMGRKIGGRRALSKTTSLPAHLFSGSAQF